MAAHQLVQQEGVAHSVHSGHNDVGVLSLLGDGSRVYELSPGDPFYPGLVKGEGVDSLAFWEDLGDLDWGRLQHEQASVFAACVASCCQAGRAMQSF